MSTLSLRLPDSLHEQVKELSRRDGISINQCVASALAEKMSALMTEEYLKEHTARGKNAFLKALRKVPDKDPEAYDRL